MKIGKLSESMLKRSVLREIKGKRDDVISGATVGNDCALFALSEDEILATCVQEGPIKTVNEETQAGFLPGRICLKACNNLATAGAVPKALLVCFFLPVTQEEQDIKEYMRLIQKETAPLQITIMGGQTCVSTGVQRPYMAVTAYGAVKKEITFQTAKPGMEIVLSKWIGLEGTAMLAEAFSEKLKKRYPDYFVEEAKHFGEYLSILPEAATAVKSGVCLMHDASKGGIFATLWEIAQRAGVGLKVDMKQIPIRQETVEVCEELGVNPYKLLSGGCLVMITDKAEALTEALLAQNIPAVSIGVLTDTKDKILVNDEEMRYLEKPDTDEIYSLFDRL